MRCRSCVVDQNISVMIQNLCIEDRLGVCAAVCKRGKCSSQLDVVDTLGDTSEGRCLGNIILHDC